MNTMPGYTAQVSLYQTNGNYSTGATRSASLNPQGRVLPAKGNPSEFGYCINSCLTNVCKHSPHNCGECLEVCGSIYG